MSSADRPVTDPDADLDPPRDPWPTVPEFVLDVEQRADEPAEPANPSIPPMPAAEPLFAQAADMRSSGDWDGAIEAYEKLLDRDDAAEAAAQASVLASIGEVKRAQGRTREAA